MFAGIFCCNFGSGSGANSVCGGSSLAPNYHHYHYHHHYLSHHHYNKLHHKLHYKTNTKKFQLMVMVVALVGL